MLAAKAGLLRFARNDEDAPTASIVVSAVVAIVILIGRQGAAGQTVPEVALVHCCEVDVVLEAVIARSEATKQSIFARGQGWIASLALAMTRTRRRRQSLSARWSRSRF